MISRMSCLLAMAMTASVVLAGEAPKADDKAIVVDKAAKRITIQAKVAPRKLAKYDQIYPIEVIACWADDHKPPGQKAHETVVTYDVLPSEVHRVLVEDFGLKPGKPAKGDSEPATGPELAIFLEVPGASGLPRKIPIEKALIDKKTNMAMPRLKYFFTGSTVKQPNPDKPDKVYSADLTGNLICVFPVTDEVVIQTNLSMQDEPLLKLETDKRVLPDEGTPVKLIIEVKK